MYSCVDSRRYKAPYEKMTEGDLIASLLQYVVSAYVRRHSRMKYYVRACLVKTKTKMTSWLLPASRRCRHSPSFVRRPAAVGTSRV